MGKRRFPNAARRNRFEIWSAAEDPKGLRVVLRENFAAAEAMVLSGRAERVRDPETGDLLGYQLKGDRRIAVSARPHKPLEGEMARSGVLTFAEAEAAAGLYGRSRTQGLSQDERNERVRNGEASEDFVERAAEKVRQYRNSSGGRYSILRERAREQGRVLE